MMIRNLGLSSKIVRGWRSPVDVLVGWMSSFDQPSLHSLLHRLNRFLSPEISSRVIISSIAASSPTSALRNGLFQNQTLSYDLLRTPVELGDKSGQIRAWSGDSIGRSAVQIVRFEDHGRIMGGMSMFETLSGPSSLSSEFAGDLMHARAEKLKRNPLRCRT